MAKRITFNYNDKEYVLEYSRKTIEEMERQGFDVTKADAEPITTLHRMFAGAFKKNHPSIKWSLIDEIFGKISTEKLMGVLIEMYQEAIETLSDGESSGEIKWEAN